jgi:hypothetical protein
LQFLISDLIGDLAFPAGPHSEKRTYQALGKSTARSHARY